MPAIWGLSHPGPPSTSHPPTPPGWHGSGAPHGHHPGLWLFLPPWPGLGPRCSANPSLTFFSEVASSLVLVMEGFYFVFENSESEN